MTIDQAVKVGQVAIQEWTDDEGMDEEIFNEIIGVQTVILNAVDNARPADYAPVISKALLAVFQMGRAAK